MKRKFEVLHSDEHALVVNKTAGVITVAGRDPEEISLHQLVKEQFGVAFPVHRIDRDTTGLVLFAKSAEAQRHFSLQFEKRTVAKTYLAIVKGCPSFEKSTIDAPLVTHARGHVRVAAGGKRSVTEVRVREPFQDFALLEVHPLTGRQHQVRVHLQHIGYPLVVDPLYHSSDPLTIDQIKSRVAGHTWGQLLARTPLHAQCLELLDVNGDTLSVEAPLPKDMRATLNQLRKWRRLPGT